MGDKGVKAAAQGGFSRTGFTDDSYKITLLNVQRYILQGILFSFCILKSKFLYLNHCSSTWYAEPAFW